MGKRESAQGSERKINELVGWTAYCDKCGKAFKSNDAVRVPYQEYPGVASSYEEVSPCCGVGYSDRPKEGVDE